MLYVRSVLLDKPFTIEHATDGVLDENTPHFGWDHVPSASRYLLEVDTSTDFDSFNLTSIEVGYANTYHYTDEELGDGQWY